MGETLLKLKDKVDVRLGKLEDRLESSTVTQDLGHIVQILARGSVRRTAVFSEDERRSLSSLWSSPLDIFRHCRLEESEGHHMWRCLSHELMSIKLVLEVVNEMTLMLLRTDTHPNPPPIVLLRQLHNVHMLCTNAFNAGVQGHHLMSILPLAKACMEEFVDTCQFWCVLERLIQCECKNDNDVRNCFGGMHPGERGLLPFLTWPWANVIRTFIEIDVVGCIFQTQGGVWEIHCGEAKTNLTSYAEGKAQVTIPLLMCREVMKRRCPSACITLHGHVWTIQGRSYQETNPKTHICFHRHLIQI